MNGSQGSAGFPVKIITNNDPEYGKIDSLELEESDNDDEGSL